MSSYDPRAASPLHHLLRQTSKQAHHGLDHHPVLAPLLQPGLSAWQYGNALAALHGVHALSEGFIHAFLDQHAELPGYRPRRRLPLLEADLAALNRSPYPLTLTLPLPQSVATLVGVLYTVEGSGMGGQIIARTLRQMGAGHLPLQFFDGNGDTAMSCWQDFLRFADAVCPPDQHTDAADTALALFNLVHRHLDQSAELGINKLSV